MRNSNRFQLFAEKSNHEINRLVRLAEKRSSSDFLAKTATIMRPTATDAPRTLRSPR